MTCYSIEPRTRKYVKGYEFLAFARNLTDKSDKKINDTAAKSGPDAAKTASKKVVYKTAEATVNKIAKIVIAQEKREEILNKLRQVL